MGGYYCDTRAVCSRLALNWVSGPVFLFKLRLREACITVPYTLSVEMEPDKRMGNRVSRTV